MLTDADLRFILQCFGIKCQGIYLKDELPQQCKAGFYIYNLDSKSKPVTQGSLGTHWTCSLNSEDKCFYMDSYGVPCPTEIEQFLKARYDSIPRNNYIVQDINSDECGLFCIAVAVYIKDYQHSNNNKGLLHACNQFLLMFSDDAKKNDKIVKDYLKKMMTIMKVKRNKRLTTLINNK